MNDNRLDLDRVRISRSGRVIVDGLNHSLEGGGIVAVIGPNGAGKSTLLAAIAGELVHEGAILWRGLPVDRRRTGYMPQASAVHIDLSVLEAVLLGRHERLGWRVGADDIDAATDALAALDLTPLAEARMNALSGGQQQLVFLAQRLVRRPELLILDESTSALDIRHQMRVLTHVGDYARETGALVLIAMHDLNLAARHASQLLLIADGRLVAAGSGVDILTPQNMRDAYGVEVEILRSASGAAAMVPMAAMPHA